MKKYLKAFVMTFSMFLTIPCPFKIWDEEARPYMNIFLPFVGGVIGGLNYLFAFLINKLNIPYLTSLVILIVPLLLTGFMHLDGFMDTIDAVGSYKPKEERIKILKDSHAGSFAIISVVLLILSQYIFGLFIDNYYILIFIPVVSRLLSCIYLLILPKISTSEYNYDKKHKTFELIYYIIFLIILIVLAFILFSYYGFILVFMVIMYSLLLIKPYKSLGGINGDVSGFLISSSEFMGIMALGLYPILYALIGW